MGAETSDKARGLIFNIQDYCIHDGPGIRTTVFLKGCPLRCQWCSNPESINQERELGFRESSCTKCGKCAPVCAEHAITLDAALLPRIDRTRCTSCGKCVEACPSAALVVYGREVTAEELFNEVRKDEIFYRGSGGGVTVSGGESLQQPQLVRELFQLCRKAGIHTAIETSGHTSPRVFAKVLAVTDYVLFDLKHMSTETHRQYTGQPNDLILGNARRVASSGIEYLFRMPLISGVNDTEWNISATAEFLNSMGPAAMRLELLPYHRMGMGKYELLDRTYLLKGVKPPEPGQVESVRAAFEALGVTCKVSR